MNRWMIAAAGTLLQLCLGTVYAWSIFQKDLVKTYGWSETEAVITFSLAIGFLGATAAWGGVKLKKYGPRKLAVTGGVLFGLGFLVAGAALLWLAKPVEEGFARTAGLFGHQTLPLLLLYLGYGVIGGIGLGLGYVTPVATVAKWFPDRKGLVTGMVVMGFGFGAVLMSLVLKDAVYERVGESYGYMFLIFGGLFLLITPLVASVLRNPPDGWLPAGYTPPTGAAGTGGKDLEHQSGRCVASVRFGMMWLVFFCNIFAGIAILSMQSPLVQDLFRKLAPYVEMAEGPEKIKDLAKLGALLVAISSLFNGVGRFFWGGLSDRIGRTRAFRLMLVTQIAAFVGLIFVQNPYAFGALVCYILLCYGGGFGTMPSYVLDVFGAKKMAVVYGVVLTAWAAAGIIGPTVFGMIRDANMANPDHARAVAFTLAAATLGLGLLISLLLSDKAFRCGKPCLKTCDAACKQAAVISETVPPRER